MLAYALHQVYFYMRDAFYGGKTAAKANKNAWIVVEGRKARNRRVGERKWATVALGSTQTRRRGESRPQLPSLLTKLDAGFYTQAEIVQNKYCTCRSE